MANKPRKYKGEKDCVGNLHYWLSEEDDINSNGMADVGEYRVISEQLSQVSFSQVVDFPLIEVNGAIPQDSPTQGGMVSLWLSAVDLAGNTLLEGGGPGLDEDLATVSIVYDSPTDLYVEDLALNLYEGKLFPGATNIFSTRLTDANGIESIDRFEFDLTGPEDEDTCLLVWRPWDGQLDYDEWCYLDIPYVIVDSHGSNEWTVNFVFNLIKFFLDSLE